MIRVIMTDIRIAIASLRATKVRTLLTTLGIVIGVGCIATVLSLTEGARNAIGSEITSLGGNILTVRSGHSDRDRNGTITNYNLLSAIGSTTLTEHDFDSVAKLPHIQAAPIMLITGSVKTSKGMSNDSQIIATNENLDSVLNLHTATGQFLDPNIDRNTVVIGNDLANEVYGADAALGQTMLLRGQPYTVIGVLKPLASSSSLSGVNLGQAAFIRLDAGKSFNQGLTQIQQIFAKPTGENMDQAAKAVSSAILKNHGGEPDFSVFKPSDTAAVAGSALGEFTAITSAIASISILVGGIGVMNIMLVSVTERTHEIGIRKSVGATNSQVMRQFIIEALIMTLSGGIVGTLLAYAAAFLISIQFGFYPGFSIVIVLVAIAVSIVTGVLFGSWPALKAARKDPITALRQLS